MIMKGRNANDRRQCKTQNTKDTKLQNLTMTQNIYLTTTLPYVNDRPHLGHALELVQADAIARFERGRGNEVFFNFGTDEHGQKILEAATKAGEPVQEYADRYAATFELLRQGLDLSYDNFIRTTAPHHILAAQEMWKRCEVAGDIYKKKYSGLYCVGCERFVTEKDLVDGKCADHGKEPVTLEEENYFFRFSKYQGKLLDYLREPGVILPEFRCEEAVKFVEGGLEDFSISRSIEKMSWGIPVPNDETQVMYVWFDALTNYISTLGWPNGSMGGLASGSELEARPPKGPDSKDLFQKFWVDGHTTQFAGKDQIRFQSLIWQAMLMSADLPNTQRVVYHGFINSGGQKMSKTLGNVLDPQALVAEYGTDAVRYFLLRHVNPFDDSDVTPERFKEAYNANLANGLGNLTSRILKMAESYLEESTKSEARSTKQALNTKSEIQNKTAEYLQQFEFGKAMEVVWNLIGVIDAEIQEKEPFKVWKEDQEKAREIVRELVADLAVVAELLAPFMPQTATKITEAITANKKPETLFVRKE